MMVQSWVEWIGLIAAITNIWGNLMLAGLRKSGWALRLVTNLLFIVYAAFTAGGWPMLLNHVAFLGINVLGWWKWQQASATDLAAAVK